MRTTFTVAIAAAMLGPLMCSQPVLAQQKTAQQCNDEWAANRAAIQATGKTKRVFVAECRGVPIGAASVAAPAALAKGQFATEDEAKASCADDAVVWVNLRSRFFHAGGSPYYGHTKQGAYMCEKASVAAGFRAAPSRATRIAKPDET
jgi:hypothetical protein